MDDSPYELCLSDLIVEIHDELQIYYDTEYFQNWLMIESKFDELYLKNISNYALEPLSDEDKNVMREKGKVLEHHIDMWKKKQPSLLFDDAIDKVVKFIRKQFFNKEMRHILRLP